MTAAIPTLGSGGRGTHRDGPYAAEAAKGPLIAPDDVTGGESGALVSLLYPGLSRLASRALRSERGDHSFQPTDLVHEAYQRLVDQRHTRWRSRAQFFGIASSLMRRILVDHARRAAALRRGGGTVHATFDDSAAPRDRSDAVDVLALHDALAELSSVDADQARIVELRFFGGFTVLETAERLGVSRATVLRDWSRARTWLRRRLSDA